MYQIFVIYSLLNAPAGWEGLIYYVSFARDVVSMADMPEQFNRILLEVAEK